MNPPSLTIHACPECGLEHRLPEAAQPRAEEPKLALSVPEAAKAAGISVTTLNELIYAGQLPSLKVGARRLIRPAALDQWLKDQEAKEVSEKQAPHAR